MSRTLLVLTILFGALVAGCIAPEQTPTTITRSTNSGGEMTAKETRDQKSDVCQGLTVDVSKSAAFCATRTIRVEGTISGLAKLDVDLTTFNGAIDIKPGSGNAYSLVATLKAQGASADEAKARVDAIEYAWSHVDNGSHFIQALAKQKSQGSNGGNEAAAIELVLPPALSYVIVATTSNGAIHAKSLRADAISAHSSNGAIDLDLDASQAEASTSNGAISATLRSVASGRFTLTTSNGKIELKVPEDATRGYDAEATTSNGKVTIGLADGKKGDCPSGSQYYTPPCDHRTFTTNNFGARAIQTRVTATSSNGEISIGPA